MSSGVIVGDRYGGGPKSVPRQRFDFGVGQSVLFCESRRYGPSGPGSDSPRWPDPSGSVGACAPEAVAVGKLGRAVDTANRTA